MDNKHDESFVLFNWNRQIRVYQNSYRESLEYVYLQTLNLSEVVWCGMRNQ